MIMFSSAHIELGEWLFRQQSGCPGKDNVLKPRIFVFYVSFGYYHDNVLERGYLLCKQQSKQIYLKWNCVSFSI